MDNEKEENLIKNKISDLVRTVSNKGITVASDFLALNEQSLLLNNLSIFKGVKYRFDGGYDKAERRLLVIYEDEEYSISAYSCVKIASIDVKFSDTLTHRDYLGAIIGLGIDRSKIGDIIVEEDIAYMFVKEQIVDFIINNFRKVKHTTVSIEECSLSRDYIPKGGKDCSGTVQSLRLDCIVALAYSISRSSVSSLIVGKKVFINGKLTLSNSVELKESDIVSVRGSGRFVLISVNNVTKKGRISITLHKY